MSSTSDESRRGGTIRRTPRRADRREQIIDVAARIFEQKGYDGTSLQEIADAVGILKGSIYHYIATKDDLLYAVVEQAHRGTMDGNTAWQQEDDPLAAIRAFVEGHIRASLGNLVYAAVYFREFRVLASERKAEINAARDEYTSALRGLIVAAQEAGVVRAEIDPAVGTLAVFGMMNFIYYWYREDGPLSDDELIARLSDLAVASLTVAPPAPAPAPRRRPSRGRRAVSRA